MPRVLITEPEGLAQAYSFEVSRQIINIGRGERNDIVLQSGACSTIHCTMERLNDGAYIIRDNASTNGVRYRDELMEIVDLYNDIEVLLGDVKLSFELSLEEKKELEEMIGGAPPNAHRKKKLPTVETQVETAPEEGKSTASQRKQKSEPKPQASGNKGFFLFLILIVLAIFIGMCIRHYVETGKMLHERVLGI